MTRQIVADQAALPVRNLCSKTTAASGTGWGTGGFGTGGAGTSDYQAGVGPMGRAVYTNTWTTPATAGGSQVHALQNQTQKIVGPYVASIWVRVNQAVSVAVRTGFITGSAIQESGTTAVPANVWTRLVFYSTVGTANALDYVAARIPSLAGTTAGLTLSATMAMVTTGSTLFDFADGNTPGWAALPDGTSIGYPYTLSRALGGRRYWMVEKSEGVTVPDLGAYEARMLIGVYDADGSLSGSYPSSVLYGQSNNTLGGMKNQLNGAGSTSTGLRSDYVGGTVNVLGYGGGRTAGRHVFSGVLNGGLASGSYRIDGAPISGSAYFTVANPGSGIPGPRDLRGAANNAGTNAEIQNVAAILVVGGINAGSELAAVNWMANHYGVPLIS